MTDVIAGPLGLETPRSHRRLEREALRDEIDPEVLY